MTPADIAPLLSSALQGLPQPPTAPLTIRPVGGGSINDSFEVLTKDTSRWFCKVNDSAKYPGLFAAEARGLGLLARPGIFRVPLTIACTVLDERQLLVLEWIPQGRTIPVFGADVYPGSRGQAKYAPPANRL